MNIINETFSNFLKHINIEDKYITTILMSIVAIIAFKIISQIFEIINNKINKNDRKKYIFNKKVKLFANIITIVTLIIVWQDYFKSILTFISFVSAALTLAIRDMIFNFFSGLYIKLKKPFSVEDRIEIDDYIGDVVNINTLNFEILEVKEEDKGQQSTGIIIHVPNSKIFSNPLKNYSKAFKYIWKEIDINVPIDCDIEKTKKEIYKIVKSNHTLSTIPNKMKNQLNTVVGEYRIYYNNLEPIIYTKIVDNYVQLSLRYLVHPKKVRIVETDLWTKILMANKENKIKLYQK